MFSKKQVEKWIKEMSKDYGVNIEFIQGYGEKEYEMYIYALNDDFAEGEQNFSVFPNGCEELEEAPVADEDKLRELIEDDLPIIYKAELDNAYRKMSDIMKKNKRRQWLKEREGK